MEKKKIQIDIYFLLIAFFCIAMILTSGGCSTTESHHTTSAFVSSSQDKVWPTPPQIPRIRYLGSVTSFFGQKIQKTWLAKTMDSIFSAEEPKKIMLRPYGVYADERRIYITDPGLRSLHIFDHIEKKYLQISTAKEERLVSPIGVTVDKNGDIYLSDSVLKKVLVYDKEGKFLREIGSPQIFERPAGIALDIDRIYVVDAHGHSILVFSKKEGNMLFSFGRKGTMAGEFNYPTNICRGRNGLFYITDSMNFRVVIADRDGKVMSSFGKPGNGSGDFSKPKGVAMDSDGHIYVADAHFDNVQIFGPDGKLLLVFGNSGQGPGEMSLPAGIFIDDTDKIYVADSYNKRIQIFQYLKERQDIAPENGRTK